MRMLLRVSIPVETGNAAVRAGTLGSTIEKILPILSLKRPISSPTMTVAGPALSSSI
jgi:hypothetical protein